jgi:hypothetical protein
MSEFGSGTRRGGKLPPKLPFYETRLNFPANWDDLSDNAEFAGAKKETEEAGSPDSHQSVVSGSAQIRILSARRGRLKGQISGRKYLR